MSSLFLSLTVKTLKAEQETITNQLTDISEDTRVDSRYAANAKASVDQEYDIQAEMIKSEMELIDDKTCPEYEELLQELNDFKEERDKKMQRIEDEEIYKEEKRDNEKVILESKLQAVNADIETFKEGRDKAIEEEFSYAS